jgi:hypothetical protein
MDSKPHAQQWSGPAAVAAVPHSGPAGSQPVFPTPIWVTIVRCFQMIFAFIVMIVAGLLIHGLALPALVFGLVTVS